MNIKKHDMHNYMQTSLGEHLKANDINQKNLAEAMGVSPQALSYQIKNNTYRIANINKALEELGSPPYTPQSSHQAADMIEHFKRNITELQETIKNQDVYIRRLLDLLEKKNQS